MGLSRRDFVAMLLGAPFAYACRGAGVQRIPPGTLYGTGMQRGHASVRDLGKVPEVTTWRTAKVVIVGSGIAGLSAAWSLRKRGITDVAILELDDVVGGTARGGQSEVTAYPWGAHYIVAPQREQTDLIALMTELGAVESMAADGTPVIDEALRCREPEERVLYRGRWYEGLYLEAGSNADDHRQLAVFRAEIDRWAGWRDAQGRRAFAIPMSRSTDDPEVLALDRISFAAWLAQRGLTSARLRWLADYACRDDYALAAADTSAWAGIFYFAARQRGPGVAPQAVVTWPDGNHALVRHLATGAKVETGVAVLHVEDAGDGARVIATGAGGAFGIRADAVVMATPRFVTRHVVRGRAAGGDYGAWAVANVHLRARPVERFGAPPAWDNVFHDSPSLGYVCATHQRGRDRGPTVWTWYYPFPADGAETRRKLAGAGYDEWAEVVLADLERAHPQIRELVEHIEIAFWGHAMIRPRVGTLWTPERAQHAIAQGRIHFAHTDLSGLALFEEAFDHGLRAAREVAEALA